MARPLHWSVVLLLLPICWLVNGPSLRAQTTGGPTVQFSDDFYIVNESDGTVILTVTLSEPAADVVTVDYATSDDTAYAGTDYTATSGTVTFPPGVTSQTVSVGIIDNDSYTDLLVAFLVTLSNPSANVTLGTPTLCTVSILDNDPAPTVDIEISGVPAGQKNTQGGFVAVNANNDNGSKLTYADGTAIPNDASGKPIQAGIPQMRDFDPRNVNLAVADPDLLEITLQTQHLKVGGPENIVLSVTRVIGLFPGRSIIKLWDTGKKNNSIAAPTNWTVATVPTSVFVEGLEEGANLREITLQLQIMNNGAVVSTDTCTLTVTPVLTNLMVINTPGTAPDLIRDAFLGWAIVSEAGNNAYPTMTENVSAQWDDVRGQLRFIQTMLPVNNLAGGWGADVAPPRKRDFAAPYSGQTLVDNTTVPFYSLGENPNLDANNVATNSVVDSPGLALNRINNVLPAVGNTTHVDVTYSFQTYATVAFQDESIYCLGWQSWSVRFAGAVTQPVAGTYRFTPTADNADTGSGSFGDEVRRNDNPAAIGPTSVVGAAAQFGWH